MSGTLGASGISRPLDLLVDQAHCSGSELSLHAQTRTDRYDFAVTRAKGMAVRHLELQPQVVARAENPKESR